MMIRKRLESLPVRDLRDLLALLRGGSIGFDPNRHPVCSKKDGLVAYILDNGNPDESAPATAQLSALIDYVTGLTPAPPAPLFPAAPATKEPAPMPATPKAAAPALDPAALASLAGALAALVPQSPSIDPAQVREIVRAELANLPPHKIELIAPKLPARVIDGARHPLFEKTLRLATSGVNVLLIGPAGAGKTTLAAQVAEALGRPFASISLTSGASESQLLGRLLPTGEAGRFEYSESPFVRTYEGGGVFLFDELDAADPNMLLVVNTALANGGFSCELRQGAEHVTRHADTVLIGSANTFGTGANAQYVGRNQLDAATLDRWYPLELDYDQGYEASLFGGAPPAQAAWKPAPAPSSTDIRELGEWCLSVRQKAQKAGLQRIASTRMIQKAVAARRALVPAAEIKRDLLTGWTRDELAKIGEAR